MASATGAYDEFIRTTGDELWDRVHHAHRRFAALLSVTPGKTEIKDSEWNAAQVAGHLLTVVRRFSQRDLDSDDGLCEDGAEVTRINADEITELGQYSVAEVLDQTWQELADLEQKLPRTTDLHRRFAYHGGSEVDVVGALGTLTGEFLLHGRDVAQARHKHWRIGSRNAALAIAGGLQLAPAFVDPEAPGDLKVELRTPESNSWVLDLVDGELNSRKATRGEQVDVRVYARTEPLLLNLYGRFGIVRATLHGTTIIGGRRPWRVARLPRSFFVP